MSRINSVREIKSKNVSKRITLHNNYNQQREQNWDDRFVYSKISGYSPKKISTTINYDKGRKQIRPSSKRMSSQTTRAKANRTFNGMNEYNSRNDFFSEYLSESEQEKTIKKLWEELGVSDEYRRLHSEFGQSLLGRSKKEFNDLEITNLMKLKDVLTTMKREVNNREKAKMLFKKIDENISLKYQYKEVPYTVYHDIAKNIENYRFYSVGCVNAINRLRELFSYSSLKGKFNMRKIYVNYSYDPMYLRKMYSDMDFLSRTSLSKFYNFYNGDPFLVNLDKDVPIEEELSQRIQQCQYIILQDVIFGRIDSDNSANENQSFSSTIQSSKGRVTSTVSKKSEKLFLEARPRDDRDSFLKRMDELNKNSYCCLDNSDLNIDQEAKKISDLKKEEKKYKRENFEKFKKEKEQREQREREIEALKQKEKEKIEQKKKELQRQLEEKRRDEEFKRQLDEKMQKEKEEEEERRRKEEEEKRKKEEEEKKKKEEQEEKRRKEEEEEEKRKKEEEEKRKKEEEEEKRKKELEEEEERKKEEEDQVIQEVIEEKVPEKIERNSLAGSQRLMTNKSFCRSLTPESRSKRPGDKFKISSYTGNLREFVEIYKEYYPKIPQAQKDIFNIKESPLPSITQWYTPKIITAASPKSNSQIQGLCIVSFDISASPTKKAILTHLSSSDPEPMNTETILLCLIDYVKEFFDCDEIYVDLYYKFDSTTNKFNIDTEIRDLFKKTLQFKWAKLENLANHIRYQKMYLQINQKYKNDLVITNTVQNVQKISPQPLVELKGEYVLGINDKERTTSPFVYDKYMNLFSFLFMVNKLKTDGFEIELPSDKDLVAWETEDKEHLGKSISFDLKEPKEVKGVSLSKSYNEMNEVASLSLNLSPFINSCITSKINGVYYNRIECDIKILYYKNPETRFYLIPSVDGNNSILFFELTYELKEELLQTDENIYKIFNKDFYSKFKVDENVVNPQVLWVPSFSIDTHLSSDGLAVFEDLKIKKEKPFYVDKVDEYMKLSFNYEKETNSTFTVDYDEKENIIKDNFVFGIINVDVMSSFNMSSVLLAYVTKEHWNK